MITSLPSAAALHSIAKRLKKKGGIVIETSTLPIDDKLKARDTLKSAGVVLLDCPLSGTGAQARNKDLSVYASGDKTAFARALPDCVVDQKILQRLEQQRAKPAATGIRAFEKITFKNHEKKILGQVLRVRDGVTAAANERENRSPISFAQIGQCLARLRFACGGIHARENHAPARR